MSKGKFHISESGDPAPCSASVQACPRGDVNEHYETPDAARTAFEASMKNSSVATLTSADQERSEMIYKASDQLGDIASDLKNDRSNDVDELAARQSADMITETVARVGTPKNEKDYNRAVTQLTTLREELQTQSAIATSHKKAATFLAASERVGDVTVEFDQD